MTPDSLFIVRKASNTVLFPSEDGMFNTRDIKNLEELIVEGDSSASASGIVDALFTLITSAN